VGGIEQLRRFQDHLHDVFVAVPASTPPGIWMKKEYVHLGGDDLKTIFGLNFLSLRLPLST
jgi:hypothetical protein